MGCQRLSLPINLSGPIFKKKNIGLSSWPIIGTLGQARLKTKRVMPYMFRLGFQMLADLTNPSNVYTINMRSAEGDSLNLAGSQMIGQIILIGCQFGVDPLKFAAGNLIKWCWSSKNLLKKLVNLVQSVNFKVHTLSKMLFLRSLSLL